MDEDKFLSEAIKDRLGFYPIFGPITHQTADVATFETKGWRYTGSCQSIECRERGSNCSNHVLHRWSTPNPVARGSWNRWAIVCIECHLLTSSTAFPRAVRGDLTACIQAVPTLVYKRPRFFEREYLEIHRIQSGWPMSFDQLPSISWDDSAISQDARNRGVSRLCHFTKVSSLESIMTGGLKSQTQLRESGLSRVINDEGMQYREGHLDWIRCTVEYPNLWNLDSYISNQSSETGEWIILLLDPTLLARPNTRFANHNAGTGNGNRILDGVDGFRAMYEAQIPLPNAGPQRRGSNHLPSCPTSLQAEVLIQNTIHWDQVLAAVVPDQQSERQVRELLDNRV